ncbi:alpha/beta fold hydrolase [Tardibacter chloracetimidivorans]|nr:alpha/beta fold hydrolase [Tardibacter chloracetimidivorans]
MSQTALLNGRKFSFRANRAFSTRSDIPMIVALHGGAHSSAYFDIKGFSLLERAAALGILAIALDRPGYGDSEFRDEAELSHSANAAILDAAIGQILAKLGQRNRGVVLIGHSIGGAIALMIAGGKPAWPLLGVAVSGVGLRPHDEDIEAWQALPPDLFIDLPVALRNIKMFGEGGTYSEEGQRSIALASVPAPRQELIDIVMSWPSAAPDILTRIDAPIHYRQGEADALWTVNDQEIRRFAQACKSAAMIDACLLKNSGHAIDFHDLGPEFQLEQLAFALKCAT